VASANDGARADGATAPDIADLVRYIAKGLVDKPDEVHVALIEERQASVYELEVAESAIREIVGRSRLDFVLEEGRQEITAKTKELIQRTLASYKTGIEVTTVNLQGVNVPEQVQSSQRDAIKAREDKERLENEAQAYSNEILPKARGGAARIVEDAKAYKAKVVAEAQGQADRFVAVMKEYNKAPEVTRNRLYLETLQQVYSSTSKVMVDAKGNGNLLMLPLDKLMQQTGAKPAAAAPPDSQSAAGLAANAPVPSFDPRNRDGMFSRERGVR